MIPPGLDLLRTKVCFALLCGWNSLTG